MSGSGAIARSVSVRHAALRRYSVICLIAALFIPFAGALLYFVILADSAFARVLYAATKLITVVWPLVAVRLIERRPIFGQSVDVARHFRAVPLGFLSGAIIAGLILAAYFFSPIGDYAERFAGDIQVKLRQLGVAGPAGYVVFCAFLAAVHSLIEEIYWRWYVFGSLERMVPPVAACAVGALAFAAHHYVVLGCYFSAAGTAVFGTCVGVGGAFWCWMFLRQRSLGGVWCSHALADAAIFIAGYDLLFRGAASAGGVG